MKPTPHEIGVLKEYMLDLIEQARQEVQAQAAFGYRAADYNGDDAIMDLLAILDDRMESEGVQMGLTEGFAHRMWKICNQAREHVKNTVWLKANLGSTGTGKPEVRETAYKALLEYIRRDLDGAESR